MKFCDDLGNFDPILKFQLFEGSIALFQSAFYSILEENRPEFMNPNPTCDLNGYPQSQSSIVTIQQLGNHENDYDENENFDSIWVYNNTNSPNQVQAFIGNVISFQRCSYVFNFAVANDTQKTKTYNIQRHTVSIEYVPSLHKKRTIFNKRADYNMGQISTQLGYEDFPCQRTQFYYHPGIQALMYMLDNNDTIIIKVDTALGASDPCVSNFLGNAQSLSQSYVNIKQLIQAQGFTVKRILENWVFLNQTLFLVVHGYDNSTNGSVNQTRIVKLYLNPLNQTYVTRTLTTVASIYGFIDQIAAFEMKGFVYTLYNDTGYYLAEINQVSLNSISKTTQFAAGTKWKIYQSRVDNHMHRPIWGVNASEPSAISRITTTYSEVLYDKTLQADFYNFTLQFARYHAIAITPGLCGSPRNTSDYNNMRAIVINLRRFEIEKCIGQSLIGCGDGKLDTKNDEQCDDGNLNDGDGCSSVCTIETLWRCTQVQGETSQCSPIICGNLKPDQGEECDDGNFIGGDGCDEFCKVEAGWSCVNFTICDNMCGDGIIYWQNKTDASNQNFTFYVEPCDKQKGCVNETCQPILGWNCTADLSKPPNATSQCIQTCGNKKHESWEVCDDGNNVGGDGCAQGCMQVEFPYQCPLVGKCSNLCGNGWFNGIDASIGKNDGDPNEHCDDGNNQDGDGCTSTCQIETGYSCRNYYYGLVYEIPQYKSVCTKINGGTPLPPGPPPPTPTYYKTSDGMDFTSTNFAAIYSQTGKFRLLESNDNMDLFGVSFVARAYDQNSNYLINAFEYTQLRQILNGTIQQYKTAVSKQYYQRAALGQFYFTNLNQIQFGFYSYVPQDNGDILYQQIYQTTPLLYQQLAGSNEIYWWPYPKLLLARFIDGYYWKSYKFTENALGVAKNRTQYSDYEWFENGLQREILIEGDINLQPIFYKNYMMVYVKKPGQASGKFIVFKYYDQMEYLAPYNQEVNFTESSFSYLTYSFVYFGEDFGVLFKGGTSGFQSQTLYRLTVPLVKISNPVFNANGFITSYSLSSLIMIQRRQDPLNPEEDRDVYGYFDDNALYRITANATSNMLTIVEKISIPVPCAFISRSHQLDIGKYHLVIYSSCNCDVQIGTSTISTSATYFYSFLTKQWTCIPMENTSKNQFAWYLPE